MSDENKDETIDSMMSKGLRALSVLLRQCYEDIRKGDYTRETVMNLKDCMTMLDTLKKRENALLEELSNEELEEIAKAAKK